MARMSDRYDVASARHAAMVATAGKEPVAYYMRFFGRVIRERDGGEYVLDIPVMERAKAVQAMMAVNGGYLKVKGHAVTKVVCSLKDLPPPKNTVAAIFTRRGGKREKPSTAYVRFAFSRGKPHIAVTLPQAMKLRLMPEDMTEKGGPFKILL